MGFEPTTSTLARLHSTTELHPLRVCFPLRSQCLPRVGMVKLRLTPTSVNHFFDLFSR